MLIPFGAYIPLCLQLYDCDPTKYVKAFLYDNANNLLTTLILSPTGSLGLYTNLTYQMPAVPFVNVQYVVYDDSGYTTISLNEGAGQSTFALYSA